MPDGNDFGGSTNGSAGIDGAVGEQPATAALHGGVDEQPVLVDQPAAIKVCARLMLPVSTMSLPGCGLQLPGLLAPDRPPSTVEFSHSGSVIVVDTTYLATLLR